MMLTANKLKQHLDILCRSDPALAAIRDRHGYPAPRIKPPGYETLLQIMVSQQLSTKAAAAIWGKLSCAINEEITPSAISAASEQLLRESGLSRRKIEYAKNLAQMVLNEEIDLDFAQVENAERVIESLCRIRGVGPWTAQIYAMFSLGEPDIYPAKDLALQVGVQWYLGMDQRPDEQKVIEIAKRWSPYRTAVSLLMWKYYGATTLDLGRPEDAVV